MPQMAPLYWLPLMLFFSILVFFISTLVYFTLFSPIKMTSNSFLNSKDKKMLSWVW